MQKGVAIVPAGASVSNGIQLGGDLPGHLIVQAALDAGITTLSFDVAHETDIVANLVWVPKYVFGTEVTMAAASSKSDSFNPADWIGTGWMRVRLGTKAAPVTVAVDTTFMIGIG